MFPDDYLMRLACDEGLDFLKLLNKLELIGLGSHKVSHQMTLITGHSNIKLPDYCIPLPVIDLSINYLRVFIKGSHV